MNKMIKRKLLNIGKSKAVTLPYFWIQKFELEDKSFDEVLIEIHGDRLIIYPNLQEDSQNKNV